MNKEQAAKKELGATIKRQREEKDRAKTGRRSKAGNKPQGKHFDKKKGKISGPPKKKVKQ